MSTEQTHVYKHHPSGKCATCKGDYSDLAHTLNPFDQWCVKNNIEYAKTEGVEVVVNRLRAGGYNRTANHVLAAFQKA